MKDIFDEILKAKSLDEIAEVYVYIVLSVSEIEFVDIIVNNVLSDKLSIIYGVNIPLEVAVALIDGALSIITGIMVDNDSIKH